MVGSVKKSKGTLEAIQAMALVRQQVPQAQLYIAGGFTPVYQEYGDQVLRYVSDIGAEEYVHFLGHLGHEELLEAYRTSQVSLFPTYLESSSVAVAEAMAAGLPSVVSDIGGTAHMIQDGVTGYRVPVADIQTLAERTASLLLDEEACRRQGQRAREFAKAHHSAELAASKTHALYLELANSLP
jgi:glycosyltransferase involved in cell wall biosynthesis